MHTRGHPNGHSRPLGSSLGLARADLTNHNLNGGEHATLQRCNAPLLLHWEGGNAGVAYVFRCHDGCCPSDWARLFSRRTPVIEVTITTLFNNKTKKRKKGNRKTNRDQGFISFTRWSRTTYS